MFAYLPQKVSSSWPIELHQMCAYLSWWDWSLTFELWPWRFEEPKERVINEIDRIQPENKHRYDD